jgi:hypothetical protein
MERLQIRDLAGLARYAIRTGLISADSHSHEHHPPPNQSVQETLLP